MEDRISPLPRSPLEQSICRPRGQTSFNHAKLTRSRRPIASMADNTQRPRPPPNRRRDKAQLSCDPCRHRKYALSSHHKVIYAETLLHRLRCDRQHPCGACSRRGINTSCQYATGPSSPDAQRSIAPRQSSSLHGRISELENLVVTLVEGHSPSELSAPNVPRQGPLAFADVFPEIQRSSKPHKTVSESDPGTLKLRESGSSYVESGHWEAILTKIRGLKEDFITDSKAPRGSLLFYGPNRHASRQEILAAVPPRQVVDRLMALHFDSYIITPCQYIQALFPSSWHRLRGVDSVM